MLSYNSKKYFILFILVVLLALFVRSYNLTFRSIWGDEAHSIYNVYNFTVNESIKNAYGNLIKDSHFPSYFILLSLWVNFLGVSEFVLRFLSVITGTFCVIAIFLFSKKLFDTKLALLASFLLSISSLAIMHSQEIRLYSLLMLLSLLSCFYFWMLIFKDKKFINSMLYIVFTLLLLLTHIYASLVVASQIVFLVFCLIHKKEDNEQNIFSPFIVQMVAILLASPFYIKMLLTNFMPAMSPSSDMAFSVFPIPLKIFLFFFVLSLGETLAPWNLFVVIPSGLIFGVLFCLNFRYLKDKRIVFLIILTVFPTVVSAFFLKPTMPKYLISILPFYLILIAYQLMQIKLKFLRYFLIFLIVLSQSFSIFNYFTLKEYHNSNQIEPWRDVAYLIEDKYKDGDIIITTNNFITYRILGYYLNILNNKNYPIFDFHKDIYSPIVFRNKELLVFSKEESLNLFILKKQRVWLVTHIADERALPSGFIDKVKVLFNENYKLVLDEKFIPYEETLVSKLPIKRHKPGSCRIRVMLYIRNK